MTTALSLNLNKIALIRNSRPGEQPSPVEYAQSGIQSGCQGITVHPRPDQRHIRPHDVKALAEVCRDASLTQNCSGPIEFNIEGNPFAPAQAPPVSSSAFEPYPGLLALIESTRPQQATLVPDVNDQLTSDHGFDLSQDTDTLLDIIQQIQSWDVRVSLFMDPDIEQIRRAAELGIERIELYTGPYAEAFAQAQLNPDLAPRLDDTYNRYLEAAKEAQACGLGVNAGHDLSLDNLPRFLGIPNILEVSIGHALTQDALKMGWKMAVHSYAELCQ